LVGLREHLTEQEAHLSYRNRATRYISLNIVICCMIVRKITFAKSRNRQMTLKVTQGHWNCRYSTDHVYHFVLVVCCSNNDSIFYRFRTTCITTYTLYITACDLKKSSVSKRVLKYMHFSINS